MAKIMNPELRQTLQSISRNIESANEAAQENIYTFTQLYIDPCLSGLKGCLTGCTAPCFPGREEQSRRKRGRSRGRAELNFDFYDDWDEDEDLGNNLMGWGNDELDSLLAGSSRQGTRGAQPRRQRAMSYGARGRVKRSPAHNDGEDDPTVIPSSSYLGFLERLPFKFGGELRYKPSASDLQEHPGRLKRKNLKEEPLLEAEDEVEDMPLSQRRYRSATTGSRSTTNSLSSRGDLIPSDEEADAVPLDDEFAMVLARRTTTTTSEDQGSGRSRSSRKPPESRTSTRTLSSQSNKNSNTICPGSSMKSLQALDPTAAPPIPSLAELPNEGAPVRVEEESEPAKKGEMALKLAVDRGLSSTDEVIDPRPWYRRFTDKSIANTRWR